VRHCVTPDPQGKGIFRWLAAFVGDYAF